ncbi:hypothetical protein [Streptomyces sp. GC420]|uniref:hypothetical protein n=1 Tax=Streptomyces sp. GC420 TaxID=2697568 RepID=UPI001414E89E|nr:hypothetical protein [Streptomyces sp. GC420]NBM16200.1 hypothetical protein [Streptomyces sp. GC420]
MRTRFRYAAVVLPLSLSLAACGAVEEDGQGESVGAGRPGATGSSEPAEGDLKGPESPEDFLDLAAKAMAEEGAWTFSVEGQEGVTLQGQKSAATYRATVRRGMEPEALHSQGASTSNKGTTKNEEIYVVDGTAYLKDGSAPWKNAPASEPEMRNKIEDPIEVIEYFREYVRTAGDDVTLNEADGTIRLRVGTDRQKLTAVRDRAWAEKARREFAPTADQLRKARIPVNDAQLTLSGLEEVLVLDAATYRIRSHRLQFGFLVPYDGGQEIVYEQDVRQRNEGAFDGKIELPAGVR